MSKQVLYSNKKNGQIYDLNEFRKNKPFFTKPMRITVGHNPVNSTYYLLKNIVYDGKQILALRKEQEPSTILVAEGKIEDGKLQYLLKLPDESLKEITVMLESMIKNTLVVDNNQTFKCVEHEN
jgi:hypothetical protein